METYELEEEIFSGLTADERLIELLPSGAKYLPALTGAHALTQF